MKIVVVGASGYIGKPLYILAKEKFDAYGTSRAGVQGLIPLSLDVPDEFNYDLIHYSDVVLVAAAISAPDVCSREHDRAWAVNVTGTSSFIYKVISKGAKVIFFSSDAVYGERVDEFDETAICNPSGDYAVMKHEVENRFIGNPGFKSIRLSYVFSTEDKFTKYLHGCARSGEEAGIFHPFYRAVVHRDDVVQGAIALAQRWGEFPQSVINFGGPDVIARIQFAQLLKDRLLPALRFKQIEPESDFFANRPRVIQMKSPLLASLLGHAAHSLHEAAQLESGI
ncbi:dTDP-4-dehydrorhamnose reductase [Nitrosospira sp. Nsp18]|uniref:NAD-dependent epimerase/dehydratase family protein n=1 Tax=Nitrosospira sp. Nsp18 TaxID=1855334 RepID=UPI0008803376|nr:sugar nucleotide-binding protein [Nitrosospira sp. Nsp18]SDA21901.1 dTDP-4-dehydrorhamnose reductase [Nitrosospira sp. Nsp18]